MNPGEWQPGCEDGAYPFAGGEEQGGEKDIEEDAAGLIGERIVFLTEEIADGHYYEIA